VALHVVDLACTLPEQHGRPVSQWDSPAIADQLVADGRVDRISPQTVQRILARHRLKPWRCHSWLHPPRPRDASFLAQVREVADLYTRLLTDQEVVLCVDALTQLQPRPRPVPMRPARPGWPRHLEHTYARAGALNLFAAWDTRSGQVSGFLARRKRQAEFLRFLAHLDALTPTTITTIHLVLDNVSVHHGKLVRAWLADHPRFALHFLPVHSSWMNQVEQWFSILRRARLRHATFADLDALADAIIAFTDQWNRTAHPFRWTAASFDKVIATVEATLSSTAPEVA
jgi:transposase